MYTTPSSECILKISFANGDSPYWISSQAPSPRLFPGASESVPRASDINSSLFYVDSARQRGQHAHLGVPCRDVATCLPGTFSCIPQGCLPNSLQGQPGLRKNSRRKKEKWKGVESYKGKQGRRGKRKRRPHQAVSSIPAVPGALDSWASGPSGLCLSVYYTHAMSLGRHEVTADEGWTEGCILWIRSC